MSSLVAQLRKVWKHYPSNSFRTDSGGKSFAELQHDCASVVAALEKRPCPKGVAVVALTNRLELGSIIPALWKLGYSIALASPKYNQAEVAAIVSGLRPYIIVTDTQHVFTDSIKEECPCGTEYQNSGNIIGYTEYSFDNPIVRDKWFPIIKLTSGSTGIPKAVALTESNLLAEASNITHSLDITDRDLIFAPVPLVHSYGCDLGLLMMMLTGASLETSNGFIPRGAAEAVQRASIFLGVPAMYQSFLETRFSQPPQFQKPRILMSCTAPLSPLTITSFYEKFRAAISQHYGSSEAGAVTFQLPADVLSFPGSVGKPMSGVTVRIVDEADVSLPELKTGEIIVAGDAVATQYVMGEPEGHSLLSEGTYRTGDIGYMDANGFLFVTGRADQLINVGGLKVSPAEIVGVLESWEKVKEAAVKGIVNRLGTTIVCAFVAVREKLTEQDVIDFCRARLADYKVPRRVIFVTQLPRTTTGKVMISALDSMYIET